MKISVAICTYNGQEFLQEQLDSFAAQTRLPDEVVVCDDCSKDSTRQILTDFAEQAAFPVNLHFNEQNLGYVRNFEKAVSLCDGDIIALSDQDDVWEMHKLAVIQKTFAKSENVGLVYADAATVDQNLNSFNKTMWQCINFTKEVQDEFSNGKAFDLLLTDGYVLGSSMAFRAKFRDLILPIPPQDEIYFVHDNWIALMVAAVSDIVLINEQLIKYRQHSTQSSAGMKLNAQPHGFAELIKAKRRNNFYQGVINQLDIAEQRLLASSHLKAAPAASKIDAVRQHLGARSELPASIWQRLPLVGRELIGKRYHLYSNGWRSAIKDLWN